MRNSPQRSAMPGIITLQEHWEGKSASSVSPVGTLIALINNEGQYNGVLGNNGPVIPSPIA